MNLERMLIELPTECREERIDIIDNIINISNYIYKNVYMTMIGQLVPNTYLLNF